MDIDTPGGAGQTEPGDPSGNFSLVYPLPFRILSLISLGLLAWATNLHGVTSMGIDAAKVLDVRIDDLDPQSESLLPRTAAQAKLAFNTGSGVGDYYLHPSRLYPPAYQLFGALSLWTLLGWSIFHYFTLADAAAVERWTVFPFLWASVAVFFLLSPWHSFLRRERTMALRSLKRIALEGLTAPVPFCDVVMADVMTSFAKVMGDCWVSACLAFVAERGLASQVSDLRCYKEVMVPFMTRSVPSLLPPPKKHATDKTRTACPTSSASGSASPSILADTRPRLDGRCSTRSSTPPRSPSSSCPPSKASTATRTSTCRPTRPTPPPRRPPSPPSAAASRPSRPSSRSGSSPSLSTRSTRSGGT